MQEDPAAENQILVLPGDPIEKGGRSRYDSSKFVEESSNTIIALYGGLLVEKPNSLLTIRHSTRIYTPAVGDHIIGLIRHRLAESYLVDINSTLDGILNQLDFEHATKRNKPELENGQIVATKVVSIESGVGVKLTCTEKELGWLKNGLVLAIDRFEFNSLKTVISMAAEIIKFQLILGANGFIWVTTASKNELTNSQLPPRELKALTILKNVFEAALKGTPTPVLNSMLQTINN